MFDGSSIEGFVRIEESDMFLRPDLSTFRVFPWVSPTGEKVARMICDIHTPEGTPFVGCPRTTLKKVIAMAAAGGYSMNAGPEAEFFLFQTRNGIPTTETHDAAGYFDLSPVDMGEDVRREIVLALEGMGFHVEAAHHEVAPGQHEIDFRYDDVLTTADNISTFRFVVKNVAIRNGLHATFMPKPIYGINGSGMHTHMSLFSNNVNIFYDAKAPRQLSETCLQLHRRHPSPRQGILRDHQPAGEFVQATRARLRGARPTSPGRRRTAVHWFAFPQRAGWRRASSCACRIPRATPTSPWPRCCGPAWTASTGRLTPDRRSTRTSFR